MSKVYDVLRSQKTAPKWMTENTHYLVMMGSQSYGVTLESSDLDVYGWCTPPKEWVFPHLAGHIDGFGQRPDKFDQWMQHHIKEDGVEYDFSIYNVVKYLSLVMENNPNMIDSLFVPANCILHMTPTGQIIRETRKKLLHKGAYHKFKGYAYSQMSKIKTIDTTNRSNLKVVLEFEKAHKLEGKKITISHIDRYMDSPAKMCLDEFEEAINLLDPHEIYEYKLLLQALNARDEGIRLHNMDTKFAYHVVRLLDECEQILTEGDIDLQRNREQLKAIRRGEMSLKEIQDWFAQKERQLDALYHQSKLPHAADWEAGRSLLMNVLEQHYGSLSAYVKVDRSTDLIREMEHLIHKYKM